MSLGISHAGKWCVAGAVCVVFGALVPAAMGIALVAVLVLTATMTTRRLPAIVLSVLMAGGIVSGAVATERVPEALMDVPAGHETLTLRMVEDPAPRWGGYGVGVPVRVDSRAWIAPKLAIGPLDRAVEAGGTVTVDGRVRSGVRRVGNDIVAGTIVVDEVLDYQPTRNPVFALGNAVRERVRTNLGGDSAAEGLSVGLLIGDTTGIGAHELEDLRRAGLSHFVAVSGSNVAVFLAAWWILGAPLSIHPRIRVAFGLVGLAVFIVATRWEPSVVRASVMSGAVLVGGSVGLPLDPWMALGVATAGLVLLAGDLAGSVGFQLSVLATAGVLVGVHFGSRRRPSWIWMPLSATVGAQLAVAPLLLLVFGSVPLLAPLSNLIAAPVVAGTTMVGVAAIIAPFGPLAELTSAGSSLILWIAEATSGGPQLGPFGFASMCVLTIGTVVRMTRPLAVAGIALAVLASLAAAPAWPPVPTAVVMDVGQGDAILVQDPSGSAMLVDGGRDPGVLDKALRRHGVERLDVVVVTHGDADHAGGLEGLLDTRTVGEIWIPAHAQLGALLETFVDEASRRAVPVRTVEAGVRAALGSIDIEVLGPSRRYQSDNDGSVVLLLQTGRSILLPGDIGAVAQRTLPRLRPDILVVPHHGAATTDLRWLEETVGDVAVLSYGPNTYGHPHPAVVRVLDDVGTRRFSTAEHGDVSIPLTP